MDTNSLPKALPPMQMEFDFEATGALTKQLFKGTFKYNIPNIAKNSQIAVTEARLNGGVAADLDPTMKLFHFMLAYLRHCLDEKQLPAWWTDSNYGADLYDANVITDLYQKCFQFEKEWNEKVHGDK